MKVSTLEKEEPDIYVKFKDDIHSCDKKMTSKGQGMTVLELLQGELITLLHPSKVSI